MRSLKAEQVAVIKFLTLEGCTQREIFSRLKNVFSSFTIPKEKVYKLHLQFLREGLLGLQEEPPYEEECVSEVGSSSSPSFLGGCCEAEIKEVPDNSVSYPSSKDGYKSEDEDDHFQRSEDDENRVSQSWEYRPKCKSSMKAKQTWQKTLTTKSNDGQIETDLLLSDFTVKKEEELEHISSENINSPKDKVKAELSSCTLSHPSIFNSEGEALTSISRTQLFCTLCQSRRFDVPSMLKRHFQRLHLNHQVRVGPFICLICRCGCTDSVFLRSHYHCPICSYVTQKMRVVQHFRQHFINASNSEALEEFKMVAGNQKKTSAICIDPEVGLYLVPKTDNEPTHVIRRTENGRTVAKCSEALCESAMLKARKNGILDLKCKHILRANAKAIEYIDNTSIFTSILNSDYLSIGEEERDQCFYLIEQAFDKKTSPLVEWIPVNKEDVSFYSVYCDASYATFGRLVVKYDAKTNSFHCECPLIKDNVGASDINLPILPFLNSADSQDLLERLHPDRTCLLCEKRSFPFRSNLKLHLYMHIKHSVPLYELRSLLCKRDCSNSSRGHYHCPDCLMVSPHPNRIRRHFAKCHQRISSKGNVKGFSSSSQRCVLVDSNDHVYLVQKSKFGNGEPIHVQKTAEGNCTKESRCSQKICERAMATANENGKSGLECKHLREVNDDSRFQPPPFFVDENDLRSLKLSPQEVRCCLSLSKTASQKGASLVVEWVASNCCAYYSVFCKDPFISNLGRTFVVFHADEEKFICNCLPHEESDFCVYKIVSEVYHKRKTGHS